MPQTVGDLERGRGESRVAAGLFAVLLCFHVWAISVNWMSTDLPGNGFRQTQTAITAMFIQKEHNFSLAYPTPVLGKPWSIPFEFPLYQWTVIGLSNVTGIPLLQAGRAVSAICLYLSLPAIWLLLGFLGIRTTARWLVLALVVSCPLYIFYARAFLIETMALMFSLWFLVGFVAAIERKHLGWLLVANLAGAGAGLVKITTWMVYLIPAGLLAMWWLYRAGKTGGVTAAAKLGAWIAAAVAFSFGASMAWLRFADATKALNPSSRNLVSSAMKGYNFGTWENRTSPEIWAAHARIVLTNVMPLMGGGIAIILIVLAGRRWLRWIAAGVAVFLTAPVLFPVLYAWHEYYWVASSVLLLCAVGLAAGGVLERRRISPWLAWPMIITVVGLQLHTYAANLYPPQVEVVIAGTQMAKAIKIVTPPDGVLIIVGEDWGSMTPFYSGRRALMIRRNMENDIPYLREALERLRSEKVVALIVRGEQRENTRLAHLIREYFDFPRDHDFSWEDADVFLRPTDRNLALARLRTVSLADIKLPAIDPKPPSVLGREVYASELSAEQRVVFDGMSPQPDLTYVTFALTSHLEMGRRFFDAHPDTRLWFPVSAGMTDIRADFVIREGAYKEVVESDATDGVVFSIFECLADGDSRLVFERALTPFSRAEDRGLQSLHVRTKIAPGSKVMFQTAPGGKYQRDWAMWGPISITPVK